MPVEGAVPAHARQSVIWRHATARKVGAYLVAAATLAAGLILVGEEIGDHIRDTEAWIAGLGPWALVVFVALYAILSSIFVPDVLLGIVAGVSFGFWRGLVAVAFGSFTGALLQYTVSRGLLQRPIERLLRAKPAWAAIRDAVLRDQLRLQLLIRLTPLNRALTSYVLGAAGVGVSRFALACVALVPSLGLEVYAGYAAKHVTLMTSRSPGAVVLHDALLLAGLVVAVTVLVVISKVARRAVTTAAEGQA